VEHPDEAALGVVLPSWDGAGRVRGGPPPSQWAGRPAMATLPCTGLGGAGTAAASRPLLSREIG